MTKADTEDFGLRKFFTLISGEKNFGGFTESQNCKKIENFPMSSQRSTTFHKLVMARSLVAPKNFFYVQKL